MSQNWNFSPPGTPAPGPTGPKPTPRRFRKLLRREEETLESLRPRPAEEEAAAASPETPAGQTGRDAHGRFVKGNPGGTGNPFARQVAAFRKALIHAVTEEDIAEITAALLVRAKCGDVAAIKLLFAYVLGKPADVPNPDRLELEDFQLLRERLSPLEEDWHLIRKMVPVEGIVSAGHRVADLRAENWREEVRGPAEGREPPKSEATRREEEALNQAEQEELLRDLLAVLKEETAKLAPSRNGGSIAAADGVPEAAAPSRNGRNGPPAPSGNGPHGPHGPSANGPPGAGRRQ